MIGHLLGVPAGADAKQKAAPRDLVETGDLLGRLDRITLHDQADTRAHLQPRRSRSGRRQRHERVHHVVVLLRQIAALRKRRLARQRDVRVLRGPERFEATLLERASKLDRPHGIVRKEDRRPEFHACFLSFLRGHCRMTASPRLKAVEPPRPIPPLDWCII